MVRSPVVLLAFMLLAAPAGAQQPAPPATPQGPLTLLDAIRIGRQRAVSAVLAQITARIAGERVGERRADLLPTINGTAAASRQTLNLQEFGLTFPGFPPKVPDFTLWRFRLDGSQTLFNASLFRRLKSAQDSAAAAGLDAQGV